MTSSPFSFMSGLLPASIATYVAVPVVKEALIPLGFALIATSGFVWIAVTTKKPAVEPAKVVR